MLEFVEIVLSNLDRVRSLIGHQTATMSAFADLKFSPKTIETLFDEGNEVQDFAAIRLRDSQKRVGRALELLATFVEEQNASLRLRDLAMQVKYGKLEIREDIRRALMRKPATEIREKIRLFNEHIDELDHQLLGPTI
jgi:hypothetical protein